MKRKKCRTAERRKKIIAIITSLSLILCLIFGRIYVRFAEECKIFQTPEREVGTAEGIPDIEHVQHYEKLDIREGYGVGIDTSPVFHDNRLYLNVANLKDNNVWFLVRLYLDDEQIGETGIFYPNEYVESIVCSKKLSPNDKVLTRIMAYEPDTYHSEGVVQIYTMVVK